MTDFVKEYGLVNPVAQQALLDYVRRDTTTPFQQSQLYSSLEDKKFIDAATRSSVFRLFTTAEAFDLVADLVASINVLDKHTDYVLVRNDVTHIRYGKGDFFKAHEDYLSFKSNMIVEYTMLMCLDASSDIVGGETVFRINDFFQHVSKSSTTPGHIIVFRKDVCHEGKLLEQGTKEILTFNLLGVAKKCETIIAVTFPLAIVDNDDHVSQNTLTPATSSSETSVVIQALDAVDVGCGVVNSSDQGSATTTTTAEKPVVRRIRPNLPQFFLPLSIVTNTGHSLMEAFSSSMSVKQSQLRPEQRNHIWLYEEHHCSPNEFETIYKIYNRSYITLNEFKQRRALIDYYGIQMSDILIDLSGDDTAVTTTIPNAVMSPTFREPLILCRNEAHAYHIKDLILTEKLPYVYFKMILAEGVLTYGGGMSEEEPTHLTMTPLWVVFGDEWRMLFESRFVSRGKPEESIEKLIADHNVFVDEDTHTVVDEDGEYRIGPSYYFGLCVAEPNRSLSIVVKRLVDPESDILQHLRSEYPEIQFEEEEKEEEEEEEDETIPPKGQWFDISEGYDSMKQLLAPRHYAAIVARVKEVDLFNQIRDQLKNSKLCVLLPQTKQKESHHFCNESVYGSATFVVVDGFMRMEK